MKAHSCANRSSESRDTLIHTHTPGAQSCRHLLPSAPARGRICLSFHLRYTLFRNRTRKADAWLSNLGGPTCCSPPNLGGRSLRLDVAGPLSEQDQGRAAMMFCCSCCYGCFSPGSQIRQSPCMMNVGSSNTRPCCSKGSYSFRDARASPTSLTLQVHLPLPPCTGHPCRPAAQAAAARHPRPQQQLPGIPAQRHWGPAVSAWVVRPRTSTCCMHGGACMYAAWVHGCMGAWQEKQPHSPEPLAPLQPRSPAQQHACR